MAVQVFNASNVLVGTFVTIQEAINASGDGYRLSVGSGTYVEQVAVNDIDNLTIEAAPGATVTIRAPVTLLVSGTHAATHAGGADVYAVLTVTDSTNVTIHGINVDGAGSGASVPATTNDLAGVFFRNSSGGLVNVAITGVRDPYPGGVTVDGYPVTSSNQRGTGVVVDNDTLLSFTMTGGSISDFQKNAGRFWDADLDISGVTVTGTGAQTGPTQNGFVVDSGTGSISGNTLTDIGYAGPVVAYSVVIYIRGATDLDVTNNIIIGTNDATLAAKVLGIAYYDINSANNGGEITGNTISYVDTGVDVEGALGAPAIVVNGNIVTNIDVTDAFSPAGVYFAPEGSLTLAFDISGSGVHDFLAGATGADTFTGLGGNDEFQGNGGNDVLRGDGGADQADYAGNFADYTVTYETDGNGTVIGFLSVTDNNAGNGDEGADTLSSIEAVKFADIVLDLGQPVQLFNGATLVGTFTTIQAAVDAADDGYRISVGSGTYVEQVVVNDIDNLTIEAAPGASVTIQAPLTLVATGEHAATHQGGADVFAVLTAIDSLNLTIDGIDIDGAGNGTSIPVTDNDFAGVFFRNSSGELTDVDITGIRDPYPGGTTVDGFPITAPYQRGTGVVVDNDTLLSFTMTGGSIEDFQKNAGRFWEADLDISGVTVTGGGAQTGPAQNGFVVDSGTGSISGNTLTDIGYAGPVVTYSVVIYIRGATDLDVTNNVITGTNDATLDAKVLGIAYYDINSANNGGVITGNTISWVDTGVDVEGALGAPAIVINGNIVTNIDVTDAFSPAGVYFLPNEAITLDFSIEGSGVHDYLAGAAGNDIFTGLAGNDELVGNGGNDYLDGGANVDRLEGGIGNDVYAVDNAADQVIELTGEGTDIVYTSSDYTLASDAEVEVLAARDNSLTVALSLIGNDFTNTIYGNNGANYIDGMGGSDSLVGFGGNDTYAVDSIGDQVFEGAGGGNDTVYASTSYVLNAGTSVEVLAARDNSSTAAQNLIGNEVGQVILGSNGANFIDGGAGADIMVGYGGNDSYAVDNSADLVLEDAAGGTDAVYTTASYTLAAGSSVEVLAARDNSATTALNLTGNEIANTVLGNNGANLIDGKGGSDILAGYGGADTFAFTTALGASNVDYIDDFAHGTDKIALDDAVFTAIGAPGALSANAFVTGTAAGDADDRIIYNNVTGQLYYDADGNGAGVAVLFANLNGLPALTASDFVVI
jgi:Ca2+-binding RTX toxin-like protein